MELPKLLKNKKLHKLANEHLVEGLLFREFEIDIPNGEKAWKQQWFHNTVLRDTLSELAPRLGDKVIVLKGMALLDSIYEDSGKRFMSDIDLLVPEADVKRIGELLNDEGFKPISESLWYGNDFKSEWTKTINGIEVNIELHSRLFYHAKDIEWKVRDYSISPLKILNNEEMILHLIGHCAFQHNFLKLYWLLDIYLFQKNRDIDWDRVLSLAVKMDLVKAVEATVWVLNNYLDCHVTSIKEPSDSIKRILTEELILNPNQGGADYLKLKHLLKDSVLESLRYDFLWTLMKVKSLFLKSR